MTSKRTIDLLILCLFALGIYFCFVGGYGSDEDTLPMIHVFERRLSDGGFVTSRFTGFPVAEMGIGFLSFFLGSWASNLATFLFLFFGLFFFYNAINDKNNQNINLFILLCLSSPILFFDNLEPVDYSWAFFNFALGVFFLRYNKIELAILFFAISIGVRINYVLFVLIAIFFFELGNKINLTSKINIFLTTFVFGGLFYLPIWYDNSFSLEWLTAARPINEGVTGILTRFLYKTYIAIGYISFFIIIYLLLKRINELKNIKNIKFLYLICIANLLIFVWIPSELSYLQLFLIILNYLIFKIGSKQIIYLVCILNFISWIIFVNPLAITYEDNSYCGPKNAIAAKISFNIENGYLKKYIDSRDKIRCWIDENSVKGIKILNGAALK